MKGKQLGHMGFGGPDADEDEDTDERMEIVEGVNRSLHANPIDEDDEDADDEDTDASVDIFQVKVFWQTRERAPLVREFVRLPEIEEIGSVLIVTQAGGGGILLCVPLELIQWVQIEML